jgi:hypothetical protein
MKLLIIQCPLASCHFLLLRNKYSPQHPVQKNTLNICSSLNVRNQEDAPYCGDRDQHNTVSNKYYVK